MTSTAWFTIGLMLGFHVGAMTVVYLGYRMIKRVYFTHDHSSPIRDEDPLAGIDRASGHGFQFYSEGGPSAN
jgi:hypothetical protein